MNKIKITKEYNKKIKLLKKYDKFYYENNNPKINDSEYDDLKKDILKLESEFIYLKSKDSPSEKVGYKPSKNFQKVTHRVPMLSLSNAFTEEDLINCEKKVLNFLSLKKILTLYTAEPKIDGISASLIYKNGELQKGLSRGDGKEGKI